MEGCKRGPTLGRLTCCCHSSLKVAGLGTINNVLVHRWVSYRAKSFMRMSTSVCLYGRRINLSVVNMSTKQLPKGCRGLRPRSCLMRITLLDHVALVLIRTERCGLPAMSVPTCGAVPDIPMWTQVSVCFKCST